MPAGQIAAVILAAGQSSRMGCNKLVLEIDGKPMLRHVAEAAIASRACRVVAVLGKLEIVAPALDGLDIALVENPDFHTGMSSSIRAGIAALPDTIAGALILLGDMPAISPPVIDRVIARFGAADAPAICVATYDGRRGHPVIFARHYFPELLKLESDVGARSILAEHADRVYEIESDDDSPLIDLDTPEALAAFRARK
jgi:molybdenum cofactor cytidylyltransferase